MDFDSKKVLMFGGAAIAGIVVIYLMHKNSAQSSDAISQSNANNAQLDAMATLQNYDRQILDNLRKVSVQVDANSLQMYSEGQVLASYLGHQWKPPTWRKNPNPTAYPSWLNYDNNNDNSNNGLQDYSNNVSDNIAGVGA
jgi:hypothetical protein